VGGKSTLMRPTLGSATLNDPALLSLFKEFEIPSLTKKFGASEEDGLYVLIEAVDSLFSVACLLIVGI